jgi:hypothetical protein
MGPPQDMGPVQVARLQRVNTKSVCQWRRDWRAGGGVAALASKGHRPRKACAGAVDAGPDGRADRAPFLCVPARLLHPPDWLGDLIAHVAVRHGPARACTTITVLGRLLEQQRPGRRPSWSVSAPRTVGGLPGPGFGGLLLHRPWPGIADR